VAKPDLSQARATIGIVGIGLIGGSLAKAFRKRFPRRALVGIEPNAKNRALARRDRLFETLSARPTAALSRCAVVVLCAPVETIRRLLGPVSARMSAGAILTDVAGVKEAVLEAARSRVRPDVVFVGAHPMFGGESGGYAAARAELWKGSAVAVCTDGAPEGAIGEIVRFHRALGARVVLCTAAAHDAATAAVSHLPYVIASALSVTARDAGMLARRLAGRGFSDATRLAAFAYPVQGEASRRNRHLVHAVRAFGANLRALLDALAASPIAARAAFQDARAAKTFLTARPDRRRPKGRRP
jgi:prephenate dehydrogenase